MLHTSRYIQKLAFRGTAWWEADMQQKVTLTVLTYTHSLSLLTGSPTSRVTISGTYQWILWLTIFSIKSYLFALIEVVIPIKALFVNPQQKFALGLECELMFHKEAQNHHLGSACSDDLAVVSVGTLVPVQKILLISLNIGQRGLQLHKF